MSAVEANVLPPVTSSAACHVGRSLPDTLYSLHADLASIVADHGLSLHQYADDSQIYGSCQSDATSSLSNTVSQCVDDISKWMRSNRLQLNADKTEVMWCCHNYPAVRSLLLEHSCVLSTLFVTSVYSSTTTSVRLLTFSELCHAVSPHSASFVTFVDTPPTTASVPW